MMSSTFICRHPSLCCHPRYCRTALGAPCRPLLSDAVYALRRPPLRLENGAGPLQHDRDRLEHEILHGGVARDRRELELAPELGADADQNAATAGFSLGAGGADSQGVVG